MIADAGILNKRAAPSPGLIEIGAGSPEPDMCEVRGMLRGCNGGWCLVRPIPLCQFGFRYGSGYLCRHPQIDRIIARTRAAHSSISR